MVTDRRGHRGAADQELLDRAGRIRWGSADLDFLATSYPPLPTAIASVLPSTLALALVGALAAGVLLDAVHTRLSRAGLPWWARAVLLVCLGASPGFQVTTTGNLGVLLSLVLLLLATDGFLRFVLDGQTLGGFQAGLFIGLAYLCHPIAVVAAVGFAVTGPLLARERLRGQRAAGRATALVLVFPTVAGVLAWTYLCWRFTGSPLVWLHLAAPAFPLGGGASPLPAATGVLLVLAASPVAVLVPALLVLGGRGRAALGLAVPVVCLVVGAWVGVGYPAPAVAVLLGVIAVAAVPPRLPRSWLAVLLVTAVVGLAVSGAAVL